MFDLPEIPFATAAAGSIVVQPCVWTASVVHGIFLSNNEGLKLAWRQKIKVLSKNKFARPKLNTYTFMSKYYLWHYRTRDIYTER